MKNLILFSILILLSAAQNGKFNSSSSKKGKNSGNNEISAMQLGLVLLAIFLIFLLIGLIIFLLKKIGCIKTKKVDKKSSLHKTSDEIKATYLRSNSAKKLISKILLQSRIERLSSSQTELQKVSPVQSEKNVHTQPEEGISPTSHKKIKQIQEQFKKQSKKNGLNQIEENQLEYSIVSIPQKPQLELHQISFEKPENTININHNNNKENLQKEQDNITENSQQLEQNCKYILEQDISDSIKSSTNSTDSQSNSQKSNSQEFNQFGPTASSSVQPMQVIIDIDTSQLDSSKQL